MDAEVNPGAIPAGSAGETPLDELAAEITDIASRVNVVSYRWLVLIAEFDRRQGWAKAGARSCAHWLHWRCGLDLGAAREKVRVAHALERLPLIAAAMASGELSYSKVRALTRVACAANEAELLAAARQSTAHHLETLVRQYRRTQELAELTREARQFAKRQLLYSFDEDGSLLIRARLTAEAGAQLLRALAAALEELPRESPTVAATVAGGVSAETARRLACDASLVAIIEDNQGEPLDVGRKTRTIPPAIRRALAARDGGCVFPGCTHRRYVDGHHLQHWADGGVTSLANLITLCRFHHRAVHEGGIKVERLDDGAWRFTHPNGETLESLAHGHTRPLAVTRLQSPHVDT